MKTRVNSIPYRKKIRLYPIRYDETGSYFITICAFENHQLFGRINGGQLEINSSGLMVEKWWQKVPSKFNSVCLGDFVVMPNHFHGILTIEQPTHPGLAESDSLSHPSVPGIVQWFKSMSTNEFYRMQKTERISSYPKLWHRSYYDHVIRTQDDHSRISNYIRNNPERWIADRFYRERTIP